MDELLLWKDFELNLYTARPMVDGLNIYAFMKHHRRCLNHTKLTNH